MTLLRKMRKQRLKAIEADSLPGTSFLFLFCYEALSLVSWYRFVPHEKQANGTLSLPLSHLDPPCILCQRDKQSPGTSRPFSEQKNHRKRSDACQKILHSSVCFRLRASETNPPRLQHLLLQHHTHSETLVSRPVLMCVCECVYEAIMI